MKLCADRRGMMLVVTIITMMLVSMLGLAVVSLTTTSAHSRTVASQSNRAYYLAESGGEYARLLLKANPAALPAGTFALLDGSGSFTLSSNDDPIDPARVVIVSIGTMGQAQRRITFNVPKSGGSGGGDWPDGGSPVPGGNVSNPDPGNQTFSPVSVDGDQALRVDLERHPSAAYALSPYIYESLLYLNASSFLTGAWQAKNHFLSYDVQVKMKINFKNLDRSHMMGISFRLDSQEHGYGVSYGRASDYEYTADGDAYDGIPGEYIPDAPGGPYRDWTGFGWTARTGNHDTNVPVVVLWQNKGDRIANPEPNENPQKRWLAYAVLTQTHSILRGSASSNQVPKDWSTLMVRVKEAPSLYCSDVRSVQSGDLLSQGGSASAIVDGPPLRGGGNDGALVLSGLNGTFTAGNVSVNGTGTVSATTFRAKDNFIRTFIADTTGTSLTGDTFPLNTVRKAYPRGTYNGWGARPIENWSAAVDNFTLITWTASNPADTNKQLLASGTVVRTDVFTTPSSGSLNGPEVGLHTMGWISNNAPVGQDRDRYQKDYFLDDVGLWVDPWGGAVGYQY